MSVSPLPAGRPGPSHLRLDATRFRRTPSARRIALRHVMVVLTKWLLPAGALVLLASIALWPEIERETEAGRLAYHRLTTVDPSGRMIQARYHGMDERNRPYTVTADTAMQVNPQRVDLTFPKADMTMSNGTWLMVQSKDGVYMQHQGLLDLSGDVTLYRDDGTTMHSATATTDLKSGAAAGHDPVSAEGPFGTLDAEGFALVDKGAVIQFTGPARLVLNNHRP